MAAWGVQPRGFWVEENATDSGKERPNLDAGVVRRGKCQAGGARAHDRDQKEAVTLTRKARGEPGVMLLLLCAEAE